MIERKRLEMALRAITTKIVYAPILLLLTTGSIGLNRSFPVSRNISFSSDSSEAVIVVGTKELNQLDTALLDGGLLPQTGVINTQVFRSTRDDPTRADGDGWTYAHHMDLAVWKGRMYAAWNMTLKDEDRPPSKVVYATSPDGLTWSKPADLFPREWAWACRFYFFRAANGRMLAFCAAKVNEGKISEDKKSVLLVREIRADHQLGNVYTLINPLPNMPPYFEKANDKDFVIACREAASNNLLLEQQDYGVFLGNRRMEWHDKTAPYKGFYKFGKALCFFHRADGKVVGLSKMGFATLSDDQGISWSEPATPASLTAGSAKVWGQRTNDNRYILAYNPDPEKKKRYPLVLVQGDDGIHFNKMRVIHGEFSPLRYPGLYKDIGYQYVRGLAEWSDDHSLGNKNALWLIYSVNKEDVWISRIPLPLTTEPKSIQNENFENIQTGSIVEGWNLYCPKWAPVKVVHEHGKLGNKCLELRDGDPVDHAQAQLIIPPSGSISVNFLVKPMKEAGYLEVSLANSVGSAIVTLVIDKEGQIRINDNAGEAILGKYRAGKWLQITIRKYGPQLSILLNGREPSNVKINSVNPDQMERLVFRTGKRYEVSSPSGLPEGKDRQAADPSVFLIDDIAINKY